MSTRMTAPPQKTSTSSWTPVRPGLLQRKCACGGTPGPSGECAECRKKRLQRQIGNSETDNRHNSLVPPIVHEVLRSLGQPLDPATRAFMEPRFGHDFSQVRVHTDGRAMKSARDVNALAYTVGQNIVFGEGTYSPTTSGGRRLLAHELTHTVQQSQNGAASLAGSMIVSETGNPAEREADAVSERVSSADGNQPVASDILPVARAVQRLGNLKKIPPGLGCDIATDQPSPIAENLLFGNAVFALSPLQRQQIDNFVMNWHAAGGNAAVRVDGYASTPGTDELNWQLSCDRANAVAKELKKPSSKVAGIPDGFIRTVAQGETTEFGAEANNRRAIISSTIILPPAPPETITSQTVETSPGPRTRTTIGIGERVTLTHSPGGAAWTTTGGTLSAANGTTVILSAPDTAQTVTVRAGSATIVFTVIAPTSVTQDRVAGTGVKHTLNQADSGIASLTFLGPDTVNFSKVRWRELDVAGVATPGVYSCNPASGGHCGAGGGGAPCSDNPLSNTVVAGKGTQDLPPPDCAYSGHCNAAPPFVPGSLTLSIPYEYKVGTGAFHPFTNVAQVHTLAADASTLTTSKAGATGTTTVAAATVALPQCP